MMLLVETTNHAPAIGDAFGNVLARCWDAGVQNCATWEIVERDDGYIGVGDAARYFDGPDLWSTVERRACDQVVGRVLDVGCGAGRHSVALQAAGHEVLGVDHSPGAVAVARQRGIHAEQVAVGEIGRSLGTFDSIIMLGNNLGLLGGPDAALPVLEDLAILANVGARLLGSGLDPYKTDNSDHLAYHELNRQRGRLPGQARIRVRDGLVATEWFDYLFVSPREFEDVVRESPWKIEALEHDGPNYNVCLKLR